MNPMILLPILGVVVGVGLTFLVRYFTSPTPALDAALNRMIHGEGVVSQQEKQTLIQRIAYAGLGLEDASSFLKSLKPTEQDLTVMETTRIEHWVRKVTLTLLGFFLGIVVGFAGVVFGLSPLWVPVLGLLLGGSIFFAADIDIKTSAKEKRVEMMEAVMSFVDLLVIERAGGAGAASAITSASRIGKSKVFKILQAQIDETILDGQQPWVALNRVATDYGLPSLGRIGDVMTQAGAGGVEVIGPLREAVALMRDEALSDEAESQVKATGRLIFPQTIIFLAIFVVVLFGPLGQLMTI